MKYTIELTEKQANQINDIMIGINASWGYASAPKLKMYIPSPWKGSFAYKKGYEDGAKNQDEVQYKKGYNKGLEDAQEYIEKLYHYGMKELQNEFDDISIPDIIRNNSMTDIIAIIKAYEEKKKAEDEIKVGDVVKFNEKCHNYDHVKAREFLVLHIFDNGLVTILYDNGDTGASKISLLDKTGRHFDEIEQLLDKLRSEEE